MLPNVTVVSQRLFWKDIGDLRWRQIYIKVSIFSAQRFRSIGSPGNPMSWTGYDTEQLRA